MASGRTESLGHVRAHMHTHAFSHAHTRHPTPPTHPHTHVFPNTHTPAHTLPHLHVHLHVVQSRRDGEHGAHGHALHAQRRAGHHTRGLPGGKVARGEERPGGRREGRGREGSGRGKAGRGHVSAHWSTADRAECTRGAVRAEQLLPGICMNVPCLDALSQGHNAAHVPPQPPKPTPPSPAPARPVAPWGPSSRPWPPVPYAATSPRAWNGQAPSPQTRSQPRNPLPRFLLTDTSTPLHPVTPGRTAPRDFSPATSRRRLVPWAAPVGRSRG